MIVSDSSTRLLLCLLHRVFLCHSFLGVLQRGVGVRFEQVIVLPEGTLAHLLLQAFDVPLHLLVDGLPLAKLELGSLSPLLPLLLLACQKRKVVIRNALRTSRPSNRSTFVGTRDYGLFLVVVMA